MTKRIFNALMALFLGGALVCCTNEGGGEGKKEDTGGQDPYEMEEMNLLELVGKAIDEYDANGKVSRVFIVAHRANTLEGYRNQVPDNSIPNIELAIKHGADMVELDVRPTKDNELVLMHNATIDATTNGKGTVSELTYEDILKYDMRKGSTPYKDASGKTVKVPTLKEALLACKDRIYVNLDIAGKNVPVGKLVRIIEECGMEHQVMLYTGGDAALAREYQYKNMDIAVHPHISAPGDVQNFSSFPGALLFQYSNTSIYENKIPDFGVQVHSRGYASYTNLLDSYDKAIRDNKDYAYLDKFIASGTDFVQTDICELVDEYLAEKGLRGELSSGGGEGGDTPGQDVELSEGQIQALLPEGRTWIAGDAIGVFTDCDDNLQYILKDGAGTASGVFEGKMSENAEVLCAYYPYSKTAGDDMSSLSITLPGEVSGSPAKLYTASYSGSQLKFIDKLAHVKIRLQDIAGSSYADMPVSKVTLTASRALVGELSVDAATSSVSLVKGSADITFNLPDARFSDGLVAEASVYSSGIKGGDRISVQFDLGGTAVSTAFDAARGTSEGDDYVITLSASDFVPKIEVLWTYGGQGVLDKFQGQTPAIDGQGNVYFTASSSTELYKLSPEGKLLWHKDIGFTGSQNTHPAIEEDGSVIYAHGGNGGKGAVRAFNQDGTTKWSFASGQFFANNGTPAPNFNVSMPAVGSKCIYVGNAGTSGSVLSIDKATGQRVAYVANVDGSGGPSGGVYSGLAVTKGGQVAWFANYGMFTADRTLLDSPALTNATFGKYVPWGQRIGYSWAWKNSASGVACSTYNGKNIVACVGIEGTTSGTYKMHVIGAEAVSGTSAPAASGKEGFLFEYVLDNIVQHDNGGITVGARGEFIVSLKGEPASICAVNPDGTLAYKHEFNGFKDVVGAVAVDNNGYVHVLVDQPGTYFILKPDYAAHTCEVVVSADLYKTAVAAGVKVGSATQTRCWASPMIGDDGRMYAAVEFHNSWNDRYGMLLCLTYADVKGYCKTSSWPMKGGGPRHDGNQKL